MSVAGIHRRWAKMCIWGIVAILAGTTPAADKRGPSTIKRKLDLLHAYYKEGILYGTQKRE